MASSHHKMNLRFRVYALRDENNGLHLSHLRLMPSECCSVGWSAGPKTVSEVAATDTSKTSVGNSAAASRPVAPQIGPKDATVAAGSVGVSPFAAVAQVPASADIGLPETWSRCALRTSGIAMHQMLYQSIIAVGSPECHRSKPFAVVCIACT